MFAEHQLHAGHLAGVGGNVDPKEILDRLVADAPDADTKAKRELIREYLLNPSFRKDLHNFSWKVSQGDLQP